MTTYSDPTWCETAAGLEHVHLIFDDLRLNDPCHWNDILNGWLITKAEDVERLLRNESLSADVCRAFLDTDPNNLMANSPDLGEFFSSWMVFCDPPLHTELRGCLRSAAQSFQEHFRSDLRDIADEHLSFSNPSAVVSAQAFVRPFVIAAAGKLLCIRPDEFERVMEWSNGLLQFLFSARLDRASIELADKCLQEVLRFLDQNSPLRASESLWLSSMASLPRLQRAAAFMQILTGSYEPVSSALMAGLYHLSSDVEQKAMALNGDIPWSKVVEEALRWTSPFRIVSRVASRSFSFYDKEICAGNRVLLLIAAANRDPSVFEDPHSFNIARQSNGHFAFGLGRHYCLGAQIARVQIATGLECFFLRYPEARSLTPTLAFKPHFGAATPVDFDLELELGPGKHDSRDTDSLPRRRFRLA